MCFSAILAISSLDLANRKVSAFSFHVRPFSTLMMVFIANSRLSTLSSFKISSFIIGSLCLLSCVSKHGSLPFSVNLAVLKAAQDRGHGYQRRYGALIKSRGRITVWAAFSVAPLFSSFPLLLFVNPLITSSPFFNTYLPRGGQLRNTAHSNFSRGAEVI